MPRGKSMLKVKITYRDEDNRERQMEVGEAIVMAVRVGTPLRAAAQQAGISERALFDWLAQGREAQGLTAKQRTQRQGELAEFAAAIEKAQGTAIFMRVGRIQRAAREGAWQADAWWLERRYPKEFGRQLRVSGEEGERKPPPLSPETAKEYREAFSNAYGDGLPELNPEELLPPEPDEEPDDDAG